MIVVILLNRFNRSDHLPLYNISCLSMNRFTAYQLDQVFAIDNPIELLVTELREFRRVLLLQKHHHEK